MITDMTNIVQTKLKPYMGYSRGWGSKEGACLIFAHNGKEAKKVVYPTLTNWFDDFEWIDVAVNRLKNKWLYTLADQEMLKNNIPHVIDDAPTCKMCEYWGHKLNEEGICPNCLELKEEEAE